MLIRPIERKDYDSWLPLWQENCLHQISDDVTAETWRRLTNPKELVFGLGAFQDNQLIGFLHYVLHHTTGFIEPACYMQDLFVLPDHRGQGIAKQLVWELNAIAKKENYARLYWFVDNQNESALNLYKNLGIKMDFALYMLPTHD
ncbi:MAG: GNAT family N-acetyltransferase [Pseudomonadota bacterium]